MTNEELALLVQAGESQYMTDLWSQNQGIIRQLAKKYLWRAAAMRYDFEDLIQECFFALDATVKAYNPERGRFTTLLGFYIQTTLSEALMFRNGRDRYIVPVSLDVPVTGDDGSETALESFIPSPETLEEDIIDHVYMEQLRALLYRALSKKDSAILLDYYREPRPTAKDLAIKYNCKISAIYRILKEATRKVRLLAIARDFAPPKHSRRFRTGLQSFRTSWTSATEAAALQNIEETDAAVEQLFTLLAKKS